MTLSKTEFPVGKLDAFSATWTVWLPMLIYVGTTKLNELDVIEIMLLGLMDCPVLPSKAMYVAGSKFDPYT